MCSQKHWFLLIVVLPANSRPFLYLFDSLTGGEKHPEIIRNIKNYLSEEWRQQAYAEPLLNSRCVIESDMEVLSPKKPEQTNTYDCGIYLIMYAEKFFSRFTSFLS